MELAAAELRRIERDPRLRLPWCHGRRHEVCASRKYLRMATHNAVLGCSWLCFLKPYHMMRRHFLRMKLTSYKPLWLQFMVDLGFLTSHDPPSQLRRSTVETRRVEQIMLGA